MSNANWQTANETLDLMTQAGWSWSVDHRAERSGAFYASFRKDGVSVLAQGDTAPDAILNAYAKWKMLRIA